VVDGLDIHGYWSIYQLVVFFDAYAIFLSFSNRICTCTLFYSTVLLLFCCLSSCGTRKCMTMATNRVAIVITV